LRVISGSARGLKLSSLDGEATRPTLDRVKEALFSMLTPWISDAAVLDLFTGSGALAIEALSRGAKSAVLVDKLPDALATAKENVSRASLSERSELRLSSAEGYLRGAETAFDIIFLDPPYASELYAPCLSAIAERSLLRPGGVVSLEWDSRLGSPSFPPEYEVFRERKYGRVMITLLTLPQA